MNKTDLDRRPLGLAREIVVGLVTVVGLLFLMVAFILPPGASRDLVGVMGLILFPPGVVALLVFRLLRGLPRP